MDKAIDFAKGVVNMDTHKPQGKREKVGTGNAAKYVRRDAKGHFTTDQVDVGKSIAADKRQKAASSAPKGQKDRGD